MRVGFVWGCFACYVFLCSCSMFLPSLWCFMCCMFWFFFVANFSGAFCLNVVRICWGCCDLTIWIWGKCCVKVVYDFLVFLFISFLHQFFFCCSICFGLGLFKCFPESVWAQGSSNSGGLSLIFSSSHLHIFTSSHLLIFTSSHFTSSHLHIFSSSHLDILTSSHLHIFSSSYLLIFTSSHPHIFTSSLLALLPSCPLALSFFSISLLKAGAGAVPTGRHETQPFRTKRGWCFCMSVNMTLLSIAMDELNDTNNPCLSHMRVIEHWWDGIGEWKGIKD